MKSCGDRKCLIVRTMIETLVVHRSFGVELGFRYCNNINRRFSQRPKAQYLVAGKQYFRKLDNDKKRNAIKLLRKKNCHQLGGI